MMDDLGAKLKQMKKNHDLDMQRIKWEHEKYMLQKVTSRDDWKEIEKTLKKPLRKQRKK